MTHNFLTVCFIIQQIISNTATATYDLAKYLAKLLSPLSLVRILNKELKRICRKNSYETSTEWLQDSVV